MQHLRKPLINSRPLALSTLLATTSLLAIPAFAAVGPPTTPDMTDASDSGVSHSDNITNLAQPVFSGKGIPFASVKLFAGTTQVGGGAVLPSGQWTVAANTKLKDGSYAMSVRQTYGGVESNSSDPLNIVVDTVSPALPSVPDMIARSDHGSSNSDDLTNTTTPTFQGTGKAGEFVSLFNASFSNPAPIGTAPVGADGQWKCSTTTAFPPGTHTYLVAAQARDAAGNTSARSNPLTIAIDTERPAIATTPDLVGADDSGASKTDNITNVTLPSFTVYAEPENKVALYTAGLGSGTLIGTAITDHDGWATIKAVKPLVGNYVYALNFDKAGNQAASSTPNLDVTIDTESPSVPAKPVLDPKSDSGIAGDGITNVTTPDVGGTSADAKDVFVVSLAGASANTLVPATVNDATHRWSITLPKLKDGVYQVTVKAYDLAGNSSQSPAFQLTIDTKAPTAPSMPDLVATDDAGVSNTDNITRTSVLDLVGTSQPASTISLFNNGVSFGTTTADAQGKWITLFFNTFAKDGPLHITATAYDAAGNASAPSPELVGLFDSTAPTIALTTPGEFYKNFSVLAGTALDPGSNEVASGLVKVTMRINRATDHKNWSGSAWASVNAELPLSVVNGQWNKTTGLPSLGANPLTQLQDGEYKITLSATDKAGNSVSKDNYVTVDSALPTVAIIEPAQNSEHNGLFVNGTASDNMGVVQVQVSLQRKVNNVVYYWNGSAFTIVPSAVYAVVTTNIDKSVTWQWSVALPHGSDLVEGPYTLYAASYDGAGNIGVSPPRAFTVKSSGEVVALDATGHSGGSS